MTRSLRVLATALVAFVSLIATTGPIAAAAGSTPDAKGPSRPVSVKVVALDRSATVSWKPPTRTGSKPITGYRIQRATPSGTFSTVTTVAGSVRKLTVAGLSNGSKYRFRVAAVTSAGLGPWSTVRIVTLPTALAIASGESFTCAVNPSRTVSCWGQNDAQQLGTGYTALVNSPSPLPVAGLTNVIQITAGADHACALKADRTVWCWGSNAYNQIGSGVSFGTQATPLKVTGLTKVRSIDAGGYHTCAVLPFGAAKCWGLNQDGQLGHGDKSTTTVPLSVSIGSIVEISGGAFHTCARLVAGTAWCWGSNTYKQIGVDPNEDQVTPLAITGIAGAVSISAGSDTNCALLNDGSARCWGRGSSGELGGGITVTSAKTPQTVYGGGVITALRSGDGHTCARYADGTTKCWGSNFYLQLASSTPGVGSDTPVAQVGLGRVRTIVAGEGVTCAITVTGRPRCFGRNAEYELGNGSNVNSTVPVLPIGY